MGIMDKAAKLFGRVRRPEAHDLVQVRPDEIVTDYDAREGVAVATHPALPGLAVEVQTNPLDRDTRNAIAARNEAARRFLALAQTANARPMGIGDHVTIADVRAWLVGLGCSPYAGDGGDLAVHLHPERGPIYVSGPATAAVSTLALRGFAAAVGVTLAEAEDALGVTASRRVIARHAELLRASQAASAAAAAAARATAEAERVKAEAAKAAVTAERLQANARERVEAAARAVAEAEAARERVAADADVDA